MINVSFVSLYSEQNAGLIIRVPYICNNYGRGNTTLRYIFSHIHLL